jgi:hypothetical protein
LSILRLSLSLALPPTDDLELNQAKDLGLQDSTVNYGFRHVDCEEATVEFAQQKPIPIAEKRFDTTP